MKAVTTESSDGANAAEDKGILVAVRIRPLSNDEIDAGAKVCCEVFDNSNIVTISQAGVAGSYLNSQKGTVNEYAFDAVFDSSASQMEVYEKTAKPFIPKVIAGLNVTVFAYGATSAGKTHTMFGSSRVDEAASHAEAGIIPNAIKDVFSIIAEKTKSLCVGEKWSVNLSYIEVYNEQIYDLLVPIPTGKSLSLREDQEKGIMVIAGVIELNVESLDEVLKQLQLGNRNRKTEATMANQVSSRSHAILQLNITHTYRVNSLNNVNNGKDSVKDSGKESGKDNGKDGGRDSSKDSFRDSFKECFVESKLSLIDLAGSERASATLNRGARLMEGANINKSLLALANCINALAENNGSGKKGNVKYRDSKLTLLLKNSLEGKSNLVIIANINPSHQTLEDSHNTLKYANRAKNIKINANLKEISKDLSWAEREIRYKEENKLLRQRVALLETIVDELQTALGVSTSTCGCNTSGDGDSTVPLWSKNVRSNNVRTREKKETKLCNIENYENYKIDGEDGFEIIGDEILGENRMSNSFSSSLSSHSERECERDNNYRENNYRENYRENDRENERENDIMNCDDNNDNNEYQNEVLKKYMEDEFNVSTSTVRADDASTSTFNVSTSTFNSTLDQNPFNDIISKNTEMESTEMEFLTEIVPNNSERQSLGKRIRKEAFCYTEIEGRNINNNTNNNTNNIIDNNIDNIDNNNENNNENENDDNINKQKEKELNAKIFKKRRMSAIPTFDRNSRQKNEITKKNTISVFNNVPVSVSAISLKLEDIRENSLSPSLSVSSRAKSCLRDIVTENVPQSDDQCVENILSFECDSENAQRQSEYVQDTATNVQSDVVLTDTATVQPVSVRVRSCPVGSRRRSMEMAAVTAMLAAMPEHLRAGPKKNNAGDRLSLSVSATNINTDTATNASTSTKTDTVTNTTSDSTTVTVTDNVSGSDSRNGTATPSHNNDEKMLFESEINVIKVKDTKQGLRRMSMRVRDQSVRTLSTRTDTENDRNNKDNNNYVENNGNYNNENNHKMMNINDSRNNNIEKSAKINLTPNFIKSLNNSSCENNSNISNISINLRLSASDDKKSITRRKSYFKSKNLLGTGSACTARVLHSLSERDESERDENILQSDVWAEL